MSWSRSATSVVVLTALAAFTGAAQGVHPQFGLGGGLLVPVSDYHAKADGRGFNTAWQGLALLAFKLPGLPAGLRVDATYRANRANGRLQTAHTTQLCHPNHEKTKLLRARLS